MSTTEFVAWWGGAVSTLVLGWDIYKWAKDGPRVEVRATPNMKEFGAGADRDRTAILVTASNTGSRATTITHHLGNWHPSWWHILLRRKGHLFVIVNNGPWGPPLPHVLEPGSIWTGGIDQVQIHRDGWDKRGILRVGVKHSGSKRAVLARVRIPLDKRDGK